MLKDLKVKELRAVADEFGVDHSGSKTKAEVLALLSEEGVTQDEYNKVYGVPDEVPVPIVQKTQEKSISPESEILVRMNRANPTYEIKNHRFTKDHPYVVMSPSEAQEIFDYDPRGFTIATPRELEDYYS